MNRKAFEEALLKDRYDRTTRLVFADWLEEHGFDDEAVEQRRMATDEWVDAARWLEGFASNLGGTCTNYGERNADGTWPEQVYQEITFEDVVQAGHDYAEHEDYYVQVGSEDARSMMYAPGTRQDFWRNWQIVTGQKVEEDRQGSVFSCTC